MDNRPIGVFDSGLGGLTAIPGLRQLCPREDIIYCGDTGRVPYGTRSPETILRYTHEGIRFLQSHHVKAVLLACGTMSTVSLPQIDDAYPFPIVGVVAPAVRAAANATRNGRIGLIATTASVRSGAYEQTLRVLDPKLTVTANACPLLVPLVENGRIHKGDLVIETVLREYLQPLMDAQVDTVILGCTHYPLLAGLIAEILGDGICLVSAGLEAANALHTTLTRNSLLADASRPGSTRFFVSDSVPGFAAIGGLFLGQSLEGQVELVSLGE